MAEAQARWRQVAGSGEHAGREAPLLNICIVNPSLRSGGAEKVLAGLAGDLVRRGNAVRIITMTPPGEAPFYPLSQAIELTQLGLLGKCSTTSSPAAIARAALRLRGVLTKAPPDLVLGFTTVGNVVALLATRGLSMPVAVCEGTDPGGHRQSIGGAKSMIRDVLYRRADHVIVKTDRARRALSGIPADRISVIPNPVAPANALSAPARAQANGRWRVISVGRLDPYKGYDLLIPAFAALAPRFPDWDLVIFGDGPERGRLQGLIGGRGLERRVLLAGLTRDVPGELAASHAFAFPSRFEGFPNALAEAMAAGLPCVAFECVSGVEELVLDGETGLIALWQSPVDTLSRQLAALLVEPALRVRLGDRARVHVAAYDPAVQYARWDGLLRSLAQRNAMARD